MASKNCGHYKLYGHHNWAGYHHPKCLSCGKAAKS